MSASQVREAPAETADLVAAGKVFGRIALLAEQVHEVCKISDGDTAAAILHAVESMVSRIGAIAETAASGCGECLVTGDAEYWCFGYPAYDYMQELREAFAAKKGGTA